jgi:hypothetical protein
VKAVELEVLRQHDALVLQGAMTWESPVQESYIELMTTLPEMHIVITVDISSTIKLWDCHNSDALATKSIFSLCQILKAVFTKDGPIVLVSDMPLPNRIWNSYTEQNTCQFELPLLSNLTLPS